MTERLLTFELSSDGDELEIHGTPEGLRSLIERLSLVIARNDHEHLMSPEWGGAELSTEQQGARTRLLHKVSLYCWPSAPRPERNS